MTSPAEGQEDQGDPLVGGEGGPGSYGERDATRQHPVHAVQKTCRWREAVHHDRSESKV